MAGEQAGIWVTDPDAYRKKMDKFIAGREPMEILPETGDALAGIVSANSVEQMRARPYPGKWTPNEIIGHFTDAEWVFGYRIRLILGEDQPTILGMDQDSWVTSQRHNDREPRELLEMFEGLRRFNLAIWRQMTPADFERTGQHNERGPESLGTMLRMLAGHDLSHIDQINRYLDAIKKT